MTYKKSTDYQEKDNDKIYWSLYDEGHPSISYRGNSERQLFVHKFLCDKIILTIFVLCPNGQQSIKNLFDNLRLYELEIFLSRQAPKIVLMIFLDFCSEGA